jgi:hypothetical protein
MAASNVYNDVQRLMKGAMGGKLSNEKMIQIGFNLRAPAQNSLETLLAGLAKQGYKLGQEDLRQMLGNTQPSEIVQRHLMNTNQHKQGAMNVQKIGESRLFEAVISQFKKKIAEQNKPLREREDEYLSAYDQGRDMLNIGYSVEGAFNEAIAGHTLTEEERSQLWSDLAEASNFGPDGGGDDEGVCDDCGEEIIDGYCACGWERSETWRDEDDDDDFAELDESKIKTRENNLRRQFLIKNGTSILPVEKGLMKNIVRDWLGRGDGGTAYIVEFDGKKDVCLFSAGGGVGERFAVGTKHLFFHDQKISEIGRGTIKDIMPTEDINLKDYSRFAVFK